MAAHAVLPGLSLGAAYDAVMQSRVFGPLGMKSTTLDFAVASRREHATPHAANLRDEPVPLPLDAERVVTSGRPAGGVGSNVRDMTRYVLTELGQGVTPAGVRVLSEANLLLRRRAQVRINDKMAYGLALGVRSGHGVEDVGHTGGTMPFDALAPRARSGRAAARCRGKGGESQAAGSPRRAAVAARPPVQ